MRDVYSRAADQSIGPACLQHVAPRRARKLARPEARPPPLVPLLTPARRNEECELADDAAELDGEVSTARAGCPAASQVEVRGSVELPYRPEPPSPAGGPNSGARAYCTLPRRHGGVAAVMYKNEELPLRRTTPDGTNVYYWCDMPAKRHTGVHMHYISNLTCHNVTNRHVWTITFINIIFTFIYICTCISRSYLIDH